MVWYEADQMNAYADACVAQETAALRDAVRHYEAALKAAWPHGARGPSFEHWNSARAALKEKTSCSG